MKKGTDTVARGLSATILQSAICRTKHMHRPLPTLFYFPGLASAPIFHPDMFNFSSRLEALYSDILHEYKSFKAVSPSSDYIIQEEHKLHGGTWDWKSYILKGKKQSHFAAHCPITVEFLESLQNPKLMSQTPFSFSFFSTLAGQSEISPHYGPCNLRIRCHFPLIVPPGDCGMEIAGKQVQWTPGKPVFFDDCYQHRVWNKTNEDRVVLLFDIWHPELHDEEIEAIVDMFNDAKSKGWLT